MTKRELYTQESLDLELKKYEGVLGESFCELVEGEVPTDPTEMKDEVLQGKVRDIIKTLLEEPEKPQFILYQLPAGQRSLIGFALDKNRKLLIGYRDLDSRPPTKRIKESINEVVDEFLERE